MKDIIERFTEKIVEPFDAHNQCWMWQGSKRRSKRAEYGYLSVDAHGKAKASRLAYELFVGPIPEGHEIHHMCENPMCVRPDHLEALDHKAHSRLSRFARQTHCKHGHEFTEANTRRHRGERICRKCCILRTKIYRQRKRGLKP